MTVDVNDGRRGLGTLLRDLAEGSATLVRTEVRLAQLELTDMLSGIARGTAFIAVAAALLLLGALSLFTGLILLVGDQWLPADLYWVGALIVLVISGIIAGVFVRRGMSLLSPSQLAPDETVATLKEDKEWLKRQLTSDATSS